MDFGKLCITDKHIYYAGQRKALKYPYKKIITFRPYENGLGVYKDGANSKQQVFVMWKRQFSLDERKHGWFYYNLCMNLARIANDTK